MRGKIKSKTQVPNYNEFQTNNIRISFLSAN